jgi:hypothetical protein
MIPSTLNFFGARLRMQQILEKKNATAPEEKELFSCYGMVRYCHQAINHDVNVKNLKNFPTNCPNPPLLYNTYLGLLDLESLAHRRGN